jgi:Fe-S oxidoreductase
MWIEEQPSTTKINHERLKDVLETGAETVVTACPYCLQMFESEAGGRDGQAPVEVKDIAELVADRVGETE